MKKMREITVDGGEWRNVINIIKRFNQEKQWGNEGYARHRN